jgi:hypothetical protein
VIFQLLWCFGLQQKKRKKKMRRRSLPRSPMFGNQSIDQRANIDRHSCPSNGSVI